MNVSPFQMISDAFQARYNVNFCIQKPDGSILLTLTDARGVALQRFIQSEQWQNPLQLEHLIRSLALAVGPAAPLPVVASPVQAPLVATL